MDKFSPLEPTRLYTTSRFLSRPTTSSIPPLIGRLPPDLHLLVLTYLPIPDIPAYARLSRSTAALTRDDNLWQSRWLSLGVEPYTLHNVLDDLESKPKPDKRTATILPTDDDFGDFADVGVVGVSEAEMGDFVAGGGEVFAAVSLSMARPVVPAAPTFKAKYMRAHGLLKAVLPALLQNPSHSDLGALGSTLRAQAKMLRLLLMFLSEGVMPLRKWEVKRGGLRAVVDRFDAGLLSRFDSADSRGDEEGMREAAESSWEVYEPLGIGGRGGKSEDWEMGKVWAEKREIFYEQGRWRPLDNLKEVQGNGEGGRAGWGLDFCAMDEFMKSVLGSVREYGSRAVRVFPEKSGVLIAFAERIAVEVVGEYITPLLSRAREISAPVYLQATAASFREAWRMVDVLMEVAKERDGAGERTKAEDVVYQMFEVNMDEYLDEEVEAVKRAFEGICKGWDRKSSTTTTAATTAASTEPTTRFLSSHNPAQVKRNVLASFTDVLLLPVTIVPRAVGGIGSVLVEGGRGAVMGIGMLNPARWGGVGGGVTAGSVGGGGYSREFDGEMLFDGDGEEEEEGLGKETEKKISASSSTATLSSATTVTTTETPSDALSTTAEASSKTNKLELLLSLDVALELIHADRESLKRVETFAGYPGHYGFRVRDTIEEIFILLLGALGERHVEKGFKQATEQMMSYEPAEHEAATSVAPLLQFFELVHIGDTIQSMVQVYFDKDLAPHIDKTDFLNGVVREKKRFENTLDDSVAAGLNAGTQVLMNQVEYIILTLTKPREYYPPDGAPMELGPTKGCTEAIRCLDVHCKLLKGSTSKEVLEVFYQEVGIRLIAVLQKHIKRQIISLQGGFQVIADLNTYHSFIASLKVPNITADFSHLKMLGHVFVVEDAKDLAQIVRDVTRYGGAYRPEDIYEFVQRRSDWKKIEKTVDKTMYNLSFKEDCVVC